MRILALALRSRRFGFAIFEGPNRLLDWGVGLYARKSDLGGAASGKRVASLLDLFSPSVVVMGRTRLQKFRNGFDFGPALRSIRREASIRAIPACLMTRATVRKIFRPLHAKSKHEIATMLAQVFPEILWMLPPKRKIWQSEHPRMAMFDAVALGFAYWQRDDNHDPRAEE